MIVSRKTTKGKLRYGVRVHRSGSYEWIGTFETKREAREAEARAITAGKARSIMTCDRFVDFWLEGKRDRVKDSTYDTYRNALRGFQRDFKGIRLADVTPTRAEEWSRSQGWRVPRGVVQLFNDAVHKRLIDYSPFRGLGRRGEGRRNIDPLTKDELDHLAECAFRVHGQTMKSLVLFLAYSTVRPGEAFALEWDDIDFERMRMTISRRVYKQSVGPPKSNQSREIVLPPPARDALLPLPREDALVFRSKQGKRLSQPTLSQYWRSVESAFGKSVQPYSLRHFGAHYLYVQLGLPDRVVAVQMGHSDGGKLVRTLYGHPHIGALEEIDRAFAAKVTPLRSVAGETHGAP